MKNVTNDEIGIEVTETAIDQDNIQANCKPVSVDKSRSKQGEVYQAIKLV